MKKSIGNSSPFFLEPGERWMDAIIADVEAMEGEQQEKWIALFEHTLKAAFPAAPKRWLEEAAINLNAIGRDEFRERMTRWLPMVEEHTALPMSQLKVQLLKGLIWYCILLDDPALGAIISDVAVACFRKISGYGPRSVKVGNACIHVLGRMPGIEGVSHLSRLSVKVKNGSAQNMVNKELEAAAVRAGLSRSDLEELAVPAYGLDPVGMLRRTFGEYSVELRIESGPKTTMEWKKGEGKSLKSAPADVKRNFPEELAALKRTATDIEKMLPAQRDRIERLLLDDRSWHFDAWRERYLDHPFIGTIARRLIWHLRHDGQNRLAIWHKGRLVDARNRAVEFPPESTTVRLWNPIGFDPDTILEWRIWLEANEVLQPFKQAHREIYIITDAEISTRTYSNRFAGHILKQHQFAALCKQRGWWYALQGGFDSHCNAEIDLPRWGIRAQFWVETIPDEQQMTEAGIFLHLSTDQVRFYQIADHYPLEPMPLTEVPAVVFSEVMRDVDLFTGVCSVGNDPNWIDRGDAAGASMQDYWTNYSFGNLGATAQTRRDILVRLLPRLKIASRCSLDDKFLVVQGDIRTYKIHLGSSNILMEPNNQYLCIVQDRSRKENGQVFLPFDGDRTLSVILSKAFLLAEDAKITDPTILSQIEI